MRRIAIASALALAACNAPAGGGATAGSAGASAASASAPAPPAPERLLALLTAEHRRSAAEVLPADQQSRDVTVRRAAARALARIGGDAARPGLLRALADEDDDVVAWGAYGLGFSCKQHERETATALVARALSIPAAPAAAPATARSLAAPLLAGTAPRLDAFGAIARALGKCAADESEPTLVAWLSGPRDRAVAAALGLGDLGAVRQKLREETMVALMNLAAGSASAPPVPEALFAVGRLDNVPLSVVDRVREVATARLAEPGEGRAFAVRALGRAGKDAAPELGRVLATPGTFTAAERADAVKALSRLDKAGQRALAEAIPALAPPSDPVALTGLVGEDLGVLLAALEALQAPGPALKALRDMAALAVPPGAPASIVRRIAWIRCSSAKVLAGANYREPLLVACDVTRPPDAVPASAAADAGAPAPPPGPGQPGSIGARAIVQVIGRGELTAARLAAWRAYALGGDLRAREAALDLIGEHEEIEGAPAVLAAALEAKELGVVATAAEVIAKHPERAAEETAPRKKKRRPKKKNGDAEEAPVVREPAPAVVKAIARIVGSATQADDLELLASVVDAAGALAIKESEPKLEELCRSSYPVAREHAAKALGLLGKKVECGAPAGGGDAPAELRALPAGPVKITLQADVGELGLVLDPSVAPVVVARIAELARAGYYQGNVVHRVVAGFVTQLGAPWGDGYGGPEGKPPLRCETSPLPFALQTVGVALSGRDTGSSQIFVMHGRAPHLDGGYAWIGTATGPWAAFVDGDTILSVKVEP